MGMIGTGRILDATPLGPCSIFYMFRISMLEIDDDDGLDAMSDFVTRFDDISNGNNDMSIFYYLPVSQHFPLITPPAPTTHIYDVNDVGDTYDPLGGQSKCDFDTKDMKVTPITSSTKFIDIGTPDQPREIRIGSSLSPDESSRLIYLLRSCNTPKNTLAVFGLV